MNILFVTSSFFPYGSAGASRVKNLALSLNSNDKCNVRILALLRLIFDNDENLYQYNEPGIQIESLYKLSGSLYNILIIGKIFYLFDNHWGKFTIAKKINKINKEWPIDVIILYSWNGFVMHPIVKYANKKHIKVIADIVEWPSIKSFKLGYLSPFFWSHKKLINSTLYLVDALISISTIISNQLSKYQKPTLIVPALINPNFFDQINIDCNERNRNRAIQITYLGSLNNKDDPEQMFVMMEELLRMDYLVELNLIGVSSHSNLFNMYINKHNRYGNLKLKIKNHGRISEKLMKKHLLEADILLLPRVLSKETIMSFPARLPELLLSGTPVIVNDVGDINLYTENFENILLVQPGNIEQLLSSIIQLIENGKLRKYIGQNGKQNALDKFNYHNYSNKIFSFIVSSEL